MLLAVCQPESVRRALGHFRALCSRTFLASAGEVIQPRGAGQAWEEGNTNAYFKSCKSTDEASFLPRILNKTIPT